MFSRVNKIAFYLVVFCIVVGDSCAQTGDARTIEVLNDNAHPVRVELSTKDGSQIRTSHAILNGGDNLIFYEFDESRGRALNLQVYSNGTNLGDWNGMRIELIIPRGDFATEVKTDDRPVFIAPRAMSSIFKSVLNFHFSEKTKLFIEPVDDVPFSLDDLVLAAKRSNLFSAEDFDQAEDGQLLLWGIYSDGLISGGFLNKNIGDVPVSSAMNGIPLRFEIRREPNANRLLYSLRYTPPPADGITKSLNLLHREDERYQKISHVIAYSKLDNAGPEKDSYLFMAILDGSDFPKKPLPAKL